MRRIHLFAVRLAILAMLIDALLPTAVSAAARSDMAPPSVPLCSAAAGAPLQPKEAPVLPVRHCALCAACAACVAGLLPPRQGGGFAGGFLIGPAHPNRVLAVLMATHAAAYRTAQPRAPPAIFS